MSVLSRIVSRIVAYKVTGAVKGDYKVGKSIEKGVPPALLALAIPFIIKLLGTKGITLTSDDALQIVLWLMAGGSVIANWFKNYLIPRLAKK
jgi:xanthosine utilization system XapX-like protein